MTDLEALILGATFLLVFMLAILWIMGKPKGGV